MNQNKSLAARCEENRQRLVKAYEMRKSGLGKTKAYRQLIRYAIQQYHVLTNERMALFANRKTFKLINK